MTPLSKWFEKLTIRFPASGAGWGFRDGSGFGRGGLFGALPGSDIDWAREVGDPAQNAVVAVCLRWIADNLPEPELIVTRKQADGTEAPVANDPKVNAFLQLLEFPNPQDRKDGALDLYSTGYDKDSLLAATAASYCVTGNAYWVKDRDRLGNVVGLYWLPPWLISPAWPSAGTEFISHYVYRPGNAAHILYDRKDVVHFRWGLDSHTAGRIGTHRTSPLYREISSLNEGSTWTSALLRNGATPLVMLTPKDATVQINESVLEKLKLMWSQLTRRDNRGKPLVPTAALEVHKLGLNPNEMALDQLLKRPELLVCAAMGIHPAAIFLSQDPKGLDNGGQHAEARKQSYQDCLLPLCKRFGKTLTTQLLIPDFGADPKMQARFDFSAVNALQEDDNTKAERVSLLVASRLISRNEGRVMMGLKPMAGLDEIEEPVEPGRGEEEKDD